MTGYHNRRSIRLRGYDYSRPGRYFVTICIQDRTQPLFGNVINQNMFLNSAGKCARRCWLDIPSYFPNIELDEFVVMPNHVHGIIIINDTAIPGSGDTRFSVGANDYSPLRKMTQNSSPVDTSPGAELSDAANYAGHSMPCNGTSRTIGSIVRGFKIGVTKWLRSKSFNEKIWQRGYYDSIIRDDESFFVIRKYIRGNPMNWSRDRNNRIVSEINGSDFLKTR